MALRLASLNIQGDRHFARFLPFMADYKPDVLTLQELPETETDRVAADLGLPHHAFAPLTASRSTGKTIGQGLFSKTPLENPRLLPYAGGGSGRTLHDMASTETMAATSLFQLLAADIAHGGHTYRVATTHFPWTPKGQPDDIQRAACDEMLARAATLGDLILTGDFNAPRGGELFTRLAAAYRDNIPAHHLTSLDAHLHRAPPEEKANKMVDGLFTTPAYQASDVTLHSGLSDHMGITGLIKKV